MIEAGAIGDRRQVLVLVGLVGAVDVDHLPALRVEQQDFEVDPLFGDDDAEELASLEGDRVAVGLTAGEPVLARGERREFAPLGRTAELETDGDPEQEERAPARELWREVAGGMERARRHSLGRSY